MARTKQTTSPPRPMSWRRAAVAAHLEAEWHNDTADACSSADDLDCSILLRGLPTDLLHHTLSFCTPEALARLALTHATFARHVADNLARNGHHGVAQGLLNTRKLFVATGQQHGGQVFLAVAVRHRPAEMVAMRLFHGWSFRSITLLMRATLYREEWTTSLVTR